MFGAGDGRGQGVKRAIALALQEALPSAVTDFRMERAAGQGAGTARSRASSRSDHAGKRPAFQGTGVKAAEMWRQPRSAARLTCSTGGMPKTV